MERTVNICKRDTKSDFLKCILISDNIFQQNLLVGKYSLFIVFIDLYNICPLLIRIIDFGGHVIFEIYTQIEILV